MAAQVAIAWFGYKAIAAFEKWTVPPTIIILAVMSAVAWFGMKINWSYAGPAGNILEGSDRIAAMSAVMTAIGIGWGITWFTYAADYSRFVSTEVPKKKVYLASVLGQFIPVVWLGILGASLATNSGEVDPGKLIVQNFGVLALPVLLMVLHGPIATNILNIYTFSVATQSLDITISRRKLNLFVGVFSLAAVVFFIFQEDFAAVLDAWLIGLVAWVAAWGGVMLVHYFWIEKRWPGNPARLFDAVGTKRLPASTGQASSPSWWASSPPGCLCTDWFPQCRAPSPWPWAAWDLSWLAGGVASAATYAVLGPKVHRKYLDSALKAPAGDTATEPGLAGVGGPQAAPAEL